jgi:hypothetical protein
MAKKVTRRKRPTTKPSSNGAVVNDGTIGISVKGGRYDGQTIEMDLTLLKLASEEMERKHDLPTVDGMTQATTGFAKDLSEALVELGYNCTPAIALRAWVEVCKYFVELQKKTA